MTYRQKVLSAARTRLTIAVACYAFVLASVVFMPTGPLG